jgi:hypothetical protein
MVADIIRIILYERRGAGDGKNQINSIYNKWWLSSKDWAGRPSLNSKSIAKTRESSYLGGNGNF